MLQNVFLTRCYYIVLCAQVNHLDVVMTLISCLLYIEYTKRTKVQDQQKVARYHRLQKRCQVEEVDDILEVPVQEEEVDTQGVQMVNVVTCTDAILKIDKATSTGPE